MNVFTYPVTIKEVYLDTFGHMNNAMYLTLFEEARWEFITQRGFGLKTITKRAWAQSFWDQYPLREGTACGITS